ncbi:LacI family DNA-binding transcriptional regulator [Parerythrobacter aurantius]|uniref:LacI family DNA-binding transcriptional regulator n=1 Tax=Parerythrobacter aurantius TaxID=3127706 RepID=UPI00324FFC4F
MSSSARTAQPTINDVAARAGVSKKTVSRVINRESGLKGETRGKVEQAIAELGYVPNPQARALARRRNMTLVLLHDNPNAQTVLNFQKGVLRAIANSDLALAVRPVDRTSPHMLDDVRGFLTRHRPLGVLILPPISERDDLARLCSSLDIPYVRVGSAPLDAPDRCVASNDSETVAAACRLLTQAGHTRIGFVRGPEGFRSAAEREQGFQAAIRTAGLTLDPSLCAPGNYRFESGVAAGQALLHREDRPTAIFASNDEMAAGVMHVALEMGLAIPRELSVIGFDDSPTAQHIWPSLTTVRWPLIEMGELAAEKVAGRLLGHDQALAVPTILPSEVVARDTVGPPEAGSRA